MTELRSSSPSHRESGSETANNPLSTLVSLLNRVQENAKSIVGAEVGLIAVCAEGFVAGLIKQMLRTVLAWMAMIVAGVLGFVSFIGLLLALIPGLPLWVLLSIVAAVLAALGFWLSRQSLQRVHVPAYAHRQFAVPDQSFANSVHEANDSATNARQDLSRSVKSLTDEMSRFIHGRFQGAFFKRSGVSGFPGFLGWLALAVFRRFPLVAIAFTLGAGLLLLKKRSQFLRGTAIANLLRGRLFSAVLPSIMRHSARSVSDGSSNVERMRIHSENHQDTGGSGVLDTSNVLRSLLSAVALGSQTRRILKRGRGVSTDEFLQLLPSALSVYNAFGASVDRAKGRQKSHSRDRKSL